ncbi:hypothetical protein F8388_007209 [Cannabis sativa]|uniref:Zinc knuckle CX2CX4HX4C domain-containing protein n=1 Tax=Cannabis sativa TaxID=3483 RepID=A0A7J6EGU2_CANSA|nr:hypothetical protein F8388_007209 [Cannabis sativa]KAF4368321.1 hypothetical protein G4B88_008625 [Cannabis sativa]
MAFVVKETIKEVENVTLKDFSIQILVHHNVTKDTITRSFVSHFFAKRAVPKGQMRDAIKGMWKLSYGIPTSLMIDEGVVLLVHIRLGVPIMVGASLLDEGSKKVWCYFKFERLPLVCFKCDCLGHEEKSCTGTPIMNEAIVEEVKRRRLGLLAKGTEKEWS